MENVMENFRKEYLGSGITAFVSEAHSFGTDAVLLADFANPTKRAVCCDLGSGCGIIPLLWCKKETGKITAVEIQPLGAEQIEKAIEFNSLSDRLTAVNADLKALYNEYHDKGFEIYHVSVDTDKDSWVLAINAQNLPWPSLYTGGDARVVELYNVEKIPITYIINRDGDISSVKEDIEIIKREVKRLI